MKTCKSCGQTLERKPQESRWNWERRKYCSWQCVRGTARARDQYADLLWLLEAGTPLHEAIPRCGVPSASAAWIWAVRHNDTRLLELIRPGYNDEHNARKQRRKART